MRQSCVFSLSVCSPQLTCALRDRSLARALSPASSKLVHAAINPDPQSGAILTPIFQSTTYIQESIEQYLERGYSYSRTNNPTVSTLEEKIAILENGAGAVCFGTGMAATISVVSGMMSAEITV